MTVEFDKSASTFGSHSKEKSKPRLISLRRLAISAPDRGGAGVVERRTSPDPRVKMGPDEIFSNLPKGGQAGFCRPTTTRAGPSRIRSKISAPRGERRIHGRNKMRNMAMENGLVPSFVSDLVARVVSKRDLLTGPAAGTAFSPARLVSAPRRRRRAARSGVGHLLCPEQQRVLTYLLMMLASTRLGLRQGWRAPSSALSP